MSRTRGSGPRSSAPKPSGSTPVPPRAANKGRGPASRPVPTAKRPNDKARRSHSVWEARRRRNRLLAGGAVTVVALVVVALIAVKLGSGTATGAPREPAPTASVAKLTNVPLSTLTAAAAKVSNLVPFQAISDPPLTSGSKPELLYIGAEFCPICATERWAMVVALSHFGTFSKLSQTHSAVSDGDIPTLSFYDSTYTSPYLTFTPVETTTNQPSGNYYKTLETPTSAETAIWQSHEPQGQTFPFIDIGGKYLLESAQYPATVLEGHSFADIVNSIGSNNNTIGVYVDASAAVLTKDICALTGQQPASTCRAVAGVNAPPASTSSGSSPAK